MKFNIVLVPKNNKVIRRLYVLTQKLLAKSSLPLGYLLREGDSYPHISVFQFEIYESSLNKKLMGKRQDEILQLIWAIAKNAWQETVASSQHENILPLTTKN